jgi:hypothetical protein
MIQRSSGKRVADVFLCDGRGPATVFGKVLIQEENQVFGRWYSLAQPDGVCEWRDPKGMTRIPEPVFALASSVGWDMHVC